MIKNLRLKLHFEWALASSGILKEGYLLYTLFLSLAISAAFVFRVASLWFILLLIGWWAIHIIVVMMKNQVTITSATKHWKHIKPFKNAIIQFDIEICNAQQFQNLSIFNAFDKDKTTYHLAANIQDKHFNYKSQMFSTYSTATCLQATGNRFARVVIGNTILRFEFGERQDAITYHFDGYYFFTNVAGTDREYMGDTYAVIKYKIEKLY